jgi:hypothetical protein
MNFKVYYLKIGRMSSASYFLIEKDFGNVVNQLQLECIFGVDFLFFYKHKIFSK